MPLRLFVVSVLLCCSCATVSGYTGMRAELKSAPMKWVLIVGAIVSYLAGAGLVALQLVEWQAGRPVSLYGEGKGGPVKR